MSTYALLKIEEQVNHLSLNDLLALIEMVTHQIRKKTSYLESEVESELEAMAADPQIQRELQQIGEEFVLSEMDGLEGY